MSDFDDLRNLGGAEEDFTDFSFDDIVDDDDLAYGQEIGLEDDFDDVPPEPGPINKLLSKMSAAERMMISIMAFLIAVVFAFGLLLVTGRI